ncbi:MAG: carboxypeptidase-like regulatory domain-containing protein [Flavobacteriaceae bacterium]
MKALKFILAVLGFFILSEMTAQSFSAKVIDEKTGEPVSYATIETGKNQGIITNEEGEFSFLLEQVKQPLDSIYISYMGYETKGVFLKPQDSLDILLTPKIFELKQVFLSTEVLNAKEIIERVKENLDKNYQISLSKKKIFFRQSDITRVRKMDFGFKKSSIEELNKIFIDSISRMIPKKSSYYKEVVGDFYGDYTKHKLYVTKAAELYDKKNDLSADGLGKELERIFNENVKKDSYIKIKSGLFSTKMQVDSIIKENEEAKEEYEKRAGTGNECFQEQIKERISDLYEQLFFQEDTKIDVLDKSSRYNFVLENYTVIDGMTVYILPFTPKGSKDFKGTLYVNTQDFAIVRMDFQNVRSIQKFGLLGITYRNDVYRGKMLFGKDKNGAYSPKYLELEDGSYMGLDRPLKVIEKNKNVKGKRKQNELSLALDIRMNQVIKYELVVFESETISNSDYENITENTEVIASYLSQYDPTFWQEYSIMEPNEAIENFKVVE